MADFSTEAFSEQCYTSNINLRLSLTTSEGPGDHDPPLRWPPFSPAFLPGKHLKKQSLSLTNVDLWSYLKS